MAWILPLVLLFLLILVNPQVMVGGGGDDWHYLDAARCIARSGVCLPTNHWQARFPLLLPIGWTIALAGESEGTIALAPLLYAIAGLLLFLANVQRLFGSSAATLAGAVFAVTPIVASTALRPMVDLPEFAWIMAAMFCGQVAIRRNSRQAAALAGVALALALMTRMTAAALIPLLVLGWMLLPDRRRLAVAFAGAFIATLGFEALAYAASTGNPLFGWMLSLHHGRIPTTELPAGVDLGRSPILNLDFIRNWRRTMGIEIHWTVDPLLNLLANPLCGLTLCGALALAIVQWRSFRRDRRLRLVAGAAMLHFLLLTFVLAVDPKPRMFLLECAAAAMVIGVLGVGAWRERKRLVLAGLIVLLAVRGLVVAYDQPSLLQVRGVAAEWLATVPKDSLATDEWTRRTLGPLAGARDLPLIDAAPGRLRLSLVQDVCKGGAIVRQQSLDRDEGKALEWLREQRIFLLPQTPFRLCLVRPS